MALPSPMIPATLFDQKAIVYTENPVTGAFDVQAKVDLPCHAGLVSTKGAPDAQYRAELLAIRRLVWAPDYVMPERAQVAIGADRWNTVAGSFVAPIWPPSGAVLYRACDLVRAV